MKPTFDKKRGEVKPLQNSKNVTQGWDVGKKFNLSHFYEKWQNKEKQHVQHRRKVRHLQFQCALEWFTLISLFFKILNQNNTVEGTLSVSNRFKMRNVQPQLEK